MPWPHCPERPAIEAVQEVPGRAALLAALAGLATAGGCNAFVSTAQNAQGIELFQQARYQEALEQFQATARRIPATPTAITMWPPRTIS